MFLATLSREYQRVLRNRSSIANMLAFFALIVICYPLALGVEKELLVTLSPVALWVSALLSLLLNTHQLFEEDFENGIIDQIIVGQGSLFWYVLAKAVCFWTLSGLILAILGPLLGGMLYLPLSVAPVTISVLAVGSFGAVMINVLAASLTIALRNNSILLSLIALPLFAPTLIFGAGAISNAIEGISVSVPLTFLSALTLISVAICPLGAAFILRLSRDLS